MVKIFIPHKFTTLNEYISAERRNKYIAAKIKNDETKIVVAYLYKLTKLEKVKIDYQAVYKFTWHLKNKKLDPDNVAFARKFLLDGMVLSGLIENDGQKQIKGFTDDFVIDKDEGVEIIIQGVEE